MVFRRARVARPQHHCAGQRDRDRGVRRHSGGVRGHVPAQSAAPHESRCCIFFWSQGDVFARQGEVHIFKNLIIKLT